MPWGEVREVKITTEYIGRILESHFRRVQRTSPDQPSAPPPKTDRATFSARAEELDLALRVISTLPEARADRVAEMKSQIASGTFRVSSDKVAEKILAEARLAKLLED